MTELDLDKLQPILPEDFPVSPATVPPEGRAEMEAWVADKVRIIRYYEGKIADIEATKQLQVKQIQDHYGHKVEQVQNSIGFLQSIIREPVKRLIEGRKQKSVSTPYGRTGFRAIAPRVLWPIDSELLEMLKAKKIPAVEQTERPNKKWLKNQSDLNADGELTVTWFDGNKQEHAVTLPEVNVVPGDERFYVTVEDKADEPIPSGDSHNG